MTDELEADLPQSRQALPVGPIRFIADLKINCGKRQIRR